MEHKKSYRLIDDALRVMKTGGVQIVDEIENGLHMSLIKLLIDLYTDEEINQNNAQLLLTTHNPLLFERGFINKENAYIKEDDDFISIRQSRSIKRTEDTMKMLSHKNYFNDLVWDSKKKSTTLTNSEINNIVSEISETLEEQGE